MRRLAFVRWVDVEEGEGLDVRIGSVVIDCNDFERMSSFWQSALGYLPRERAAEGWVVLTSPTGAPPNISLQKVPERRRHKNRLHLDLYTEEPEAEIERLVGLGATRSPRERKSGEDFVVLADPEGNLFCVVDKRVRPGDIEP